jgi:hypothetical protein
MDKWEYFTQIYLEPQTMKRSPLNLDNELAKLGQQGWELVSVVPAQLEPEQREAQAPPRYYRIDYYRLFFKRRVS